MVLTFSLSHRCIVASELHQQWKECIPRSLSPYTRPADLLDSAGAFHAEVVSFALQIKSKNVLRNDPLPGFLGSMATRTMGDASNCKPVNDGQKTLVDRVADFKTRDSNWPMARRWHRWDRFLGRKEEHSPTIFPAGT